MADLPPGAALPQGMLRRSVLVAGAALLIAVWAVIAGLAVFERRDQLADADARNALFARVFAEDLTRDIDAVRQSVEALVALLDRGAPVDGAELRASLMQVQGQLGWLRGIGIVGTDGHVLAASTPSDIGRNVPLTAYGPWPAPGTARIGAPLAGRGLLDAGGRDAPPGVAFLPLLRTAELPGGRRVLVVAMVNAQAFATAQQVRLDDAASASAVLTYDGATVAGTAQVPQLPGQSVAELAPFRSFLPRRESGVWSGAGLRPGVQRAAFRLSASYPLLVMVEIDQDASLAGWRQRVAVLAGVGLVASLLIGLLTAAAARSMAARERATVERDVAQRAVVDREREFDSTLRNVQELIFRTDADGRIRFLNQRWQGVIASGPGQVLGQPMWPMVVPSQRSRARALFAPDGPRSVRQMQTQVEVEPGVLRSLDVSVQPLWHDGRLAGFAGSAVDVTERVQAQERLQAQLAFNELLMDNSPLPMSVVSTAGRYERVNRAWEAFTGQRREQVIGRPVGQHLSQADREMHRHHDQRLRATGQPQRYEASVLHADASLRDVLLSKVLLPDDGDLPGAILTVIIDVTDLRRAERATREARDAAEEASRAKSEFIANVSHELRTPLQAIIGFSELGQLRGRAQEKLAGMFGDIHAAGQRMLQLVNNLLDVAKLESAVGSIHLERADLRGLVHELLRELDPLLRARGQAVDLNLPTFPLVAKVDPLRMQQVLRNVLANAMKFSPPGSRIQLEADYNAAGEPQLVVRDAGPGIPEAEIETIFEAFAQSSRTKDGSGGTGLGLAICRTIVNAHGGRIHARNEVGGGAAFHIVLPARGSLETQPMPL
jgi:PAS domain S-box-containing protein